MAFLNRVGNVLKQTISQHVSSKSVAPSPSLFQAIRSMSSSKLFVGGLSYNTDEMSLREEFSKYGEVVEARVILDRDTGRSRGFGFVTYTSSEEASSAIQAFDGQDLHGRRVRVNYATEKPRGGGFGGGGFGGGFGAGGGGGYGGYGGQGGGYQGGGYGGSGGGAGNYSGGGGFGGGNQYQSGGGGYGGASNYPSGGSSGYGVGDSVQGDGGYFAGSQSGFSNSPKDTTTGLYGEGQDSLGSDQLGGVGAETEDFEQDAVNENDRDVDDDPSDYAKRA